MSPTHSYSQHRASFNPSESKQLCTIAGQEGNRSSECRGSSCIYTCVCRTFPSFPLLRPANASQRRIACRFRFPFDPCAATFVHDDGNVDLWRGPSDGDIVSYIPHLLCAAQQHIHTKIVFGPRAVPYVCKYLGKGDTYARAAILQAKKHKRENPGAPPVNIAHTYMNRRAVSFSEAIVRLLEDSLVNRWPPVESIRVSLPKTSTMNKVRRSAPCPKVPTTFASDTSRRLAIEPPPLHCGIQDIRPLEYCTEGSAKDCSFFSFQITSLPSGAGRLLPLLFATSRGHIAINPACTTQMYLRKLFPSRHSQNAIALANFYSQNSRPAIPGFENGAIP